MVGGDAEAKKDTKVVANEVRDNLEPAASVPVLSPYSALVVLLRCYGTTPGDEDLEDSCPREKPPFTWDSDESTPTVKCRVLYT